MSAADYLDKLSIHAETDAYGVPYGLVSDRRTGRFSVVLEVDRSPAGLAPTVSAIASHIVSNDQDGRVSGATITTESTGEPDRHELRVGVSFRPEKERADALQTFVGTRLGSVVDGVRIATGALVRTSTAEDIIDMTRVAFDPTVAGEVDRLRREGTGTALEWGEAGPAPESELVNNSFYRHDRALSTCWAMSLYSPRALDEVRIAELLRPTTGLLRQRTSLILRPSAAKPQGLAPFGFIVTASAAGIDGLPTAQGLLDTQSVRTRLKLRAARGTHDIAFRAGLPLDLATPHTHAVRTTQSKELA